LHDKTILALA